MAIEFSAQVGGRTVISSGALTTKPGEKSIVFQISNLRLEVLFEETETKETKVEGGVTGPTTLTLRLLNFDNALGVSYDSQIGTVDHRSLHLAFTTNLMGDAQTGRRAFNYTFSLGEVQNAE